MVDHLQMAAQPCNYCKGVVQAARSEVEVASQGSMEAIGTTVIKTVSTEVSGEVLSDLIRRCMKEIRVG